jgi:transcriptional regulator with XRE-family HTH domain
VRGGENMTKALGRAIKANRARKGMSIEKVSEITKISTGYLSEIERGKYNPSIKLLSNIANALGVPLWMVIKEGDEIQEQMQKEAEQANDQAE